MIKIYALIATIALASVHVFSNRLHMLDGVPRHRFLSAASGMVVAFVVLQLLPGISQGQQAISKAVQGGTFSFLERHAYLIMLGASSSSTRWKNWQGSQKASKKRPTKGIRRLRACSGCTWPPLA
jgi:hypothetical protein